MISAENTDIIIQTPQDSAAHRNRAETQTCDGQVIGIHTQGNRETEVQAAQSRLLLAKMWLQQPLGFPI